MNSLKIKQAVILAGGAGTRLRPFTLTNPKPMIPVNGVPFLVHLINLLKENGIREIVILTGYLGDKIDKYFGNGKKFGVKIKYSFTPFFLENGQETTSGLRLINAKPLLQDHFLLMYCDNYLNFKIHALTEIYKKTGAEVLVTVFSNIDSSTKNNMLVQDNLIRKYDKLRTASDLNGVDIGFMIVKKRILNALKPDVKFEDKIFSDLIRRNKLAAYYTNQKYYSIGDLKRVKQTAKFLKAKKVIFLDRDGVINKKADKGEYIKTWSDFKFLPGVLKAIKLLTDSGYKIFIITNQAGIARKMLTVKDLTKIHKNMISEIKQSGGKISRIYFCPHGWDEDCFCRKPNPGMLLQASRENYIDLSKTLFVGDDLRDKEAGDKAGVKTVLVDSKNSLLKIVYSLVK